MEALMYNALPKNERTFSISADGDTSGERFEGQFVTKCVLSMAEKHSKELEKTRLLADYANPSHALAGIAEILSTLRIKLVKWPDWWANLDYGSKILDENIVVTIYDEVQTLEQQWKAEIRKMAEDKKVENKDTPRGNG
jgi:hypothetical protein